MNGRERARKRSSCEGVCCAGSDPSGNKLRMCPFECEHHETPRRPALRAFAKPEQALGPVDVEAPRSSRRAALESSCYCAIERGGPIGRNAKEAGRFRLRTDAAATSTQMWRLSFVNIPVNCIVSSVHRIVADMTKTTQQVKFAVQRQNAEVDDWDTIRDTITPLEARARPARAVEAEPGHAVQVPARQSGDPDDDHADRGRAVMQQNEADRSGGKSQSGRDS